MNPLIKKYGKEKRWVNFRIESRNGKTTKVPYSITGKKASSTDEKSWSTYEEAKAKSANVGIVFTPDQKLLGIDIDHCLKKGTNQIIHEQKQQIAELVIEADTYTEISPSGEGLHLYLELKDSVSLGSNRKSPYEVYASGRYFTVTENPYKQSKPVRKISGKEANRLLSIIGYPWNETEVSSNSEGLLKRLELRNKSERVSDSGSKSSVFTDEEVVRRMFVSKGGEKIKALFDGSLADYENDASRADMALLSHLAFWTRKDAVQMERIWKSSKLGKRDKTQIRADYVSRSIAVAMKNCKTVYETPKIKMEEAHPDLDLLYKTYAKGEIEYLQNTENMCRILKCDKEFAGSFRYDVFKNVYEIRKSEAWRTIEDNDAVNVQTRISVLYSDYFGKVGKEMVYDAIIKTCKDNTIDSAKDYMTSLTWDGEARLDSWLFHTCGNTVDEYHKAVASNVIKGMVKRIMVPGCKFDYVLVLEGAQGIRKSSLLSVIGGEWHVETTMSTDNKDFFMQFQGKALIEFSEGETLSRTETKRLKAIITMQSDKYRPPYERTSQDYPRRCIFAMTTNQEEYLKDETGNRRWLPVKVANEKINVDWFAENRDQVFAEAYHRVIELKETIHEFPEEETLRQQAMRRISDPNADIILEWYYRMVTDEEKEQGITIERVYKECLNKNMPTRSMNKYEEMSIGTVLKNHIGLTRRRTMMRGGIRMSLWFNETGKPMIPTEETKMEQAVRNEAF